MKIQQIVEDRTQKEIDQVQKHIDRLIAEGHFKKPILSEKMIRQLNEDAQYVDVDGKWYVQYEGPSSNMHEFNSERQARNAANKFNSTGEITPGRNVTVIDRRNIERGNQEIRTARRELSQSARRQWATRWANRITWLQRLLSVVGIANVIREQREAQQTIWENFAQGYYGNPTEREAQEQYVRIMKTTYGVFVAQVVGIVVNAVATAATARLVVSLITRIVTLGALGLGGPIGAVVGFIAGTGASYGVLWLLGRPKAVESIVKWMWDFDQWIADTFALAGIRPVEGLLTAVSDIANPNISGLSREYDTARELMGGDQIDQANRRGMAARSRGTTGDVGEVPRAPEGSNRGVLNPRALPALN